MSIEFFLIVQAVIVALNCIAIFFIKKNIEHGFSARLADLEAKNRMQALEHQVRFTRFDEKVTSAIEGAYSLVCEYSDTIGRIIEQSYLDKEKAGEEYKRLVELADRFRMYMQRESIYLPTDIADKLILTKSLLGNEFRQSIEAYMERTSKKNEEGVPSISILTSIGEKEALQRKCDALMFDLQKMVRTYLSKFILRDV